MIAGVLDQPGGIPRVPLSSLYRQNKKRSLEAKYQTSDAWKQFATKICRSLAVKRALHERQAGACASCAVDIVSPSLEGCTIHHLSYDHRCTFGGNATRILDCGPCLSTAPRKAEICLSHLRLLHTACHDRRHNSEKRDPAWRQAMGRPPRGA